MAETKTTRTRTKEGDFSERSHLRLKNLTKRCVHLVILWNLAGIFLAECGPPNPWRYLRLDTQGGFLEYDFRPNGEVLQYTFDQDVSQTHPDAEHSDYFEPVFSIRHGLWKTEAGYLTVKFGNHALRMPFSESQDHVDWGESRFKKVEKISALRYVSKLFADDE